MQSQPSHNKKSFSSEIGKQEDRRLKAQREKTSVWSGLGLFGMIGWSVAVPTLLGAALGLWLDKKYPQTFSWTLSLLITGLLCGCLVAWKWVKKEHTEIHKKQEDENE